MRNLWIKRYIVGALPIVFAACALLPHPHGQWLVLRQGIRPHTFAIVPAVDDKFPVVGVKELADTMAASAAAGCGSKLDAVHRLTNVEFPNRFIAMPAPVVRSGVRPLPEDWLAPLRDSSADALLFIWARINMGLMNKGSVTYWAVLYSKSGKPVWRDEFEVRDEPLIISNGSLGPDFSWNSYNARVYKKDAENAGGDIADKLLWWLPEK